MILLMYKNNKNIIKTLFSERYLDDNNNSNFIYFSAICKILI